MYLSCDNFCFVISVLDISISIDLSNCKEKILCLNIMFKFFSINFFNISYNNFDSSLLLSLLLDYIYYYYCFIFILIFIKNGLEVLSNYIIIKFIQKFVLKFLWIISKSIYIRFCRNCNFLHYYKYTFSLKINIIKFLFLLN